MMQNLPYFVKPGCGSFCWNEWITLFNPGVMRVVRPQAILANMASIFSSQQEEMAQRTATTPGTSGPTTLLNSKWVLLHPTLNFKHRRYCETGPTVYSPYPRRLESLTISRWNCKGSTFSSVILRPSLMVWPDSNSQPPARQPDLGSGKFYPYIKEGNIPLYVHKESNHPPSILRNIPESINKRLLEISSDKESFDQVCHLISCRF